MHTTVVPRFVRRLGKIASVALVVLLSIGSLPESALAVSSWNPTLLVNTESFQTIDLGDGTTDVELRFGSSTNALKFLTTGKFQFTKSVSVQGGLSGSYLTIDRQANISGALMVKTSITTRGALSGALLRVSGPADIHGSLAASGSVRADGDLVINDDQTAADAVLTFGQPTTNQTLKFLNSSQKFQFSKSLSVVGGISGSYLTIDGQANFSGAVVGKSSITAKGVLSGASLVVSGGSSFSGASLFRTTVTAKGTISGAALHVTGNANVRGELTATGAIRTDSDLTINDDRSAGDATLTFGNVTQNQTIKFLDASQRFEFSKGIRVLGTISGSALRVDGNATIGGPLTVTGSIKTKGNLSGSTLTVDGALTLHGVTYNAPSSQGGANTVLKNDGAGNLTWGLSTIGNGSGGILSFHPEYPNAIYFSSGSTYIGQMTLSGGTTALDNSYLWTSSKAALQDYWISVRVRVPDNFSSWDPVKPIEFKYKTGVSGTTNNALKVLMRDTAGAYIPLASGEGLSNTSWTIAKITGPDTTGTWTPKGYFTVYIKLAANNSAGASAAASYINFNFESTTP